MKSAISLSFAQHRVDNANRWRNWLLYPNNNEPHRIAIALRAKKNNQKNTYQLRYFNSTPLLGYQESV
jgi:4'-phosphopantetheinyl transferase